MKRTVLLRLRRVNIFTRLIVIVLTVYALTQLTQLMGQMSEAENDLRLLQNRAELCETENESLALEIAGSDDPQALEQAAREKLGLMMPGEIIFIDISKQTGG